jgi:branched-chain amino acid transport system ATP-binding protein
MITRAKRLIHPLLLFGIVLIILPFIVVAAGGSLLLAGEIVCFALLAMALNLLLGYTGLLSFGHGLFFGMGAYAAALTQIHVADNSTLIPLLAGTLFATLVGFVVGSVVLRRRGVYFSLLTLAIGQVGFYFVYRSTEITGGENGLGGFGPVSLFGLDLSDRVNYYFFAAFLVFVSAVLMWRFVHSPFGHVLQAIRENQQRVQALGYNPYTFKLVSFTVSALFAGFAGALYAFLIRFAFAQMIHVSFSGQVVAMAVVGGIGSFFGPAIGGAFFAYARQIISSYTEYWLIVFGLLFMAFILFSPEGISGLILRLASMVGLRRKVPAGTMALQPITDSPEEMEFQSGAKVYGAGNGQQSMPTMAAHGDGSDGNAPRAPRQLGEEVLVAEGVIKRFGAFAAVNGARLRVRKGAIHAVIGPNGAGKTTFFNCLNGIIPLSEGRITYRGEDITGQPPHMITRLGMARSFQIVSVFKDLTLFENVRVAVQAVSPHKHSLLTRAEAHDDINNEARRLIREMGLAGKEQVPAGTLSHGDQRLLDITMALATKPEFLLLDEPFAGLLGNERNEISRVVRELNEERGLTVLLIEHDIERVLELSDYITVLHQGKVLAEGTPDEIQAKPEVQRAYMGEERVESVERRDLREAEALLSVQNVDAFYEKSQALEGVSLEVCKGEVVCLLGRNGAGKTTTLSTIMGTVPAANGKIVFDGNDITNWPIERISRVGIGIVPQGRRVFPNLSVRENLLLARREATDSAVPWDLDKVYEWFPKLKTLEGRRAGNLSGGERQMLAIGRALIGNPRLILLDEPFEGLAQVIIKEVVDIIKSLRGQVTILLVEQSAELALSLADRAYVLTSGQIVFEGHPEELLQNEELRNRLVGV